MEEIWKSLKIREKISYEENRSPVSDSLLSYDKSVLLDTEDIHIERIQSESIHLLRSKHLNSIHILRSNHLDSYIY